ncbi:MAG TPA: right-handed parallel beta-helix repeat-containing protein [Verrucomicrobiae bacterium]|nr:right-handed parallel beta-helix repeat-containing protein [Verrucomicrobiae bacterium]
MKFRTISRMAAAFLVSAPAAFSYGTTYVSRNGADSASCGINVAPCYSLAAALTNTDAGGTVKVLDGNAVAPLGIVVSRAVTIDGSGLAVIENIFSPGAPAIQVAANVTLRNLVIQVTSGDGILISANNVEVHIENVQIAGTPGSFSNGIHATGAGVNLTVDSSTIVDAAYGINLTGANGAFAASGLRLLGSTTAAVSMSAGSGTLRDAFLRGTGPGAASIGLHLAGGAVLALEHCELTANGTGAVIDGSATTLRLNNCTISGNGTGLSGVNSGQIISLRTNMIGGNGSDGTPALSTSLK